MNSHYLQKILKLSTATILIARRPDFFGGDTDIIAYQLLESGIRRSKDVVKRLRINPFFLGKSSDTKVLFLSDSSLDVFSMPVALD